MNTGPDCHLCNRRRVRRSHGGGRVCPYCDLNEIPHPAPLPDRRPLSSTD